MVTVSRDVLQNAIQERQEELHRIADILAQAARTRTRTSVWTRTATILLGAFITTQAVAGRLLGEGSEVVLVLYALAGFLVAGIAGLEAAFKNEGAGAELTVLAARCQSTIWTIDSAWSKTVATAPNPYEKEQAARELLDRQDSALAEIQSAAAKVGVNVSFEVRRLYQGEPPALA
jgi:hypothetical protein